VRAPNFLVPLLSPHAALHGGRRVVLPGVQFHIRSPPCPHPSTGGLVSRFISEVFGVDPAALLPRRQPAASSAGPRRTEASSSALPRITELIKDHLLPRLASGQRPLDSFIHDADVYDDVPAELTTKFAPYCSSGRERLVLFLTTAPHRNDSGKRRKRTLSMSDGWWHSDHPPKQVTMRGRGHVEVVIGYEQTLAFCTRNTDGKVERFGWLLKELTADPGRCGQCGDLQVT
jgi:hypothetical protein